VTGPMLRSAIAALACAVLGCAQPSPAPARPPAAEAPAPAALELSGRLSRKGPDETSFWAVTDGAGKAWELVGVTPQMEERFRSLQNGEVTLRVEPGGRLLLDRVRVLDVIRPAP
jgi:hypothetical protein